MIEPNTSAWTAGDWKQRKGFLVIRAYPAGLGSLLEHVVNSLLYAQLTNRIPIVFWKERCLYYENSGRHTDDPANNGFEYYFKPISSYSITDLIGKGYTYYPSKWTDVNIVDDKAPATYVGLPCELDSPGSCADVLVSEYQQHMYNLHPNIPNAHPLQSLSYEELWHLFYAKYLRLQDAIEVQVERYCNELLRGFHVLGVHVRKTDKVYEQAMPSDRRYIKKINDYISAVPDTKIFLATDCQKTLDKFRHLYGERVICTNFIRSNDGRALHFSKTDRRLNGEQMLIEMCLLSRCDYFVGTKRTNVARTVLYMMNDPALSGKKSVLLSPGHREEWERKLLLSVGLPARRSVERIRRKCGSIVRDRQSRSRFPAG